MNRRNKLIGCLVVIGVILFAVVYGVVIPGISAERSRYFQEQKEPVTHDFTRSLRFKSRYMGDASNLINLFYSLPLGDTGMYFRLYPQTLAAEISYKETVWRVGRARVMKALIYNSTAAFALIDNLETLRFRFVGEEYDTSRSDIERWYGVEPSKLAQEGQWKKRVQSKLGDSVYVSECSRKLFKTKQQ